jgi:pimeloyl-ACP methyl ester carboxylesterase
MPRSTAVDGFSLAYDRSGAGDAVVLLHGWPGDRGDWRAVVQLVEAQRDLVVPDLRGFGESDKHPVEPSEGYSAVAQTRSVAALIEELGLGSVVLAGYDIGSRIAQLLTRERPELVRALVLAPPLPGPGDRVLTAEAQREFWYQPFHRLELAEHLIDGDRDAVRAYLAHFWSRWSGPGFELPAADLDRLVEHYAPPGAFTASIAWYRSGAGAVASALAELTSPPPEPIPHPTTVLWPAHDPLFPRAWADRLDTYFAAATITDLRDAGHFSSLEAPDAWATAILAT